MPILDDRLDRIEQQLTLNNEINSKLLIILEKLVDVVINDNILPDKLEKIKIMEFTRGYNQARDLYK